MPLSCEVLCNSISEVIGTSILEVPYLQGFYLQTLKWQRTFSTQWFVTRSNPRLFVSPFSKRAPILRRGGAGEMHLMWSLLYSNFLLGGETMGRIYAVTSWINRTIAFNFSEGWQRKAWQKMKNKTLTVSLCKTFSLFLCYQGEPYQFRRVFQPTERTNTLCITVK